MRYNNDAIFGDFVFRTRVRYFDEKILKEEIKNIYNIPENPELVIDIGAHIGGTSLLAAGRGAIVYSFEPFKDSFDVLEYNVERNGFFDRIKTFNVGVGDQTITKLFLHRNMSGTHSNYAMQKGLTPDRYEEVKIISIKDVFNDNKIKRCSVLKLDCEGAETRIIDDLDEELIAKIDQISLEFHDAKERERLIEKLSKYYVARRIKKNEWVFIKNANSNE